MFRIIRDLNDYVTAASPGDIAQAKGEPFNDWPSRKRPSVRPTCPPTSSSDRDTSCPNSGAIGTATASDGGKAHGVDCVLLKNVVSARP